MMFRFKKIYFNNGIYLQIVFIESTIYYMYMQMFSHAVMVFYTMED